MKTCEEKRLEWIIKTHEQLEKIQDAQGVALGKAQELWEMMADQITALENEVATLKAKNEDLEKENETLKWKNVLHEKVAKEESRGR